jgi:hypothetical protein
MIFKMAAVVVVLDICSHYLDQDPCESGESLCVNCFKMKDYLKVVTTELKSVQLIIKILQEESRMNADKSLNKDNLVKCMEYNTHDKTSSENEWIEIQSKIHKVRKMNRPTDCKRKQNSYIPVLTNRYAPKDNEVTKVTKSRIESLRNKTKKESEIKQKIIIMGDSHARGMAKELKYRLNQEFEIQCIIKPGSTLEKLVKTTYSDLKTLTKRDVCLVWGGTHDVGRNESNIGIHALKDFVSTHDHTNVIVINVPHRYDLVSTSCVNWGMRWRSWLRHCATSRNVVGSI